MKASQADGLAVMGSHSESARCCGGNRGITPKELASACRQVWRCLKACGIKGHEGTDLWCSGDVSFAPSGAIKICSGAAGLSMEEREAVLTEPV